MIREALPLGKYIAVKKVNIYDAVFTLHSKFTVVILITFTLLLSAKQYFGEPIQCMTDLQIKDFVHSYCWTIGTFLLPSDIEQSRNTVSVGVGIPPRSNSFAIDIISLRYYQWVAIVLLPEAAFFYLPAYLWKRWEGNRMVHLCSPVAEALIPSDTRMKHCQMMVCYFNSNNRLLHGNYFTYYVTCDLLNLVVSCCNMIFLDNFLNGSCTRYNDVSQIFPKLAKCTFNTFGLGGSINSHDALCMLPLNVMNEKIFGFLFIWYNIMLLLAFLKMVYDLCILTSSSLRANLLRLRVRSIPYIKICDVLNNRTIGDWFVMYKFSLYVNSQFFVDFLIELDTCRHLGVVQII